MTEHWAIRPHNYRVPRTTRKSIPINTVINRTFHNGIEELPINLKSIYDLNYINWCSQNDILVESYDPYGLLAEWALTQN